VWIVRRGTATFVPCYGQSARAVRGTSDGDCRSADVWASVCNVIAIPLAAGLLFPSAGSELRPEWSALLMSASSIVVATNAVLLKRVETELPEAEPA
jgi:hypothetical protein